MEISSLLKMLLKFAVFVMCVLGTTGFMFNDPCNVFPQYSGGIPDSLDFTTDVNVPATCRNGTFRWDYPRGHSMVMFHNLHRTPTKICIRDALGGQVFTITDMTNNKQIGAFDEKTWACTDVTSAQEITLKIDAPEELRYMGEVEYKLV
ncbi:hypothetical protein ACF0H5_012508 [Mactra antiquata]